MLKSEKLEAGPLASFGGATRRMFKVNPLWLRWTVMPLVWFSWICFVCPFYYLGGWMFFKHGVQRQRAVEAARHEELIKSQNPPRTK